MFHIAFPVVLAIAHRFLPLPGRGQKGRNDIEMVIKIGQILYFYICALSTASPCRETERESLKKYDGKSNQTDNVLPLTGGKEVTLEGTENSEGERERAKCKSQLQTSIGHESKVSPAVEWGTS